jgi:hypothetical protein
VYLYLIELAYSFFLRDGSVGTNLSFCVPCLVTSVGFLAKLPMALGTDGPGVPDGVEGVPELLVDPLSAMKLDVINIVKKSRVAAHSMVCTATCLSPDQLLQASSFKRSTVAVTPSSQDGRTTAPQVDLQ